jgi:hypothetical protein
VNAEAALAVEASAAMSPKTSENFIFLNWGFFFLSVENGRALGSHLRFWDNRNENDHPDGNFYQLQNGEPPHFHFFVCFFFVLLFFFAPPPITPPVL